MRIQLNSNWRFRLSGKTEKSAIDKSVKEKLIKFLPATVPGTIHTDLMANKIINDPFYADNELKLGWVAESDWVYETEFYLTEIEQTLYDLVFEGLDTIAEIFLNGEIVGATNNMFLSYRYNVSKNLKLGKNILRVIFLSPVKYAEQEEKVKGKLQVALDTRRVYIRKAQYSFGWDWGPSFPTSGIWKKVYLEESSKPFISDVTFQTNSLRKDSAFVAVTPYLNGLKNSEYTISVELSNSNNIIVKKKIKATNNKSTIKLTIPEAKLWWPSGEGEQNIYQLTVKLLDKSGIEIDGLSKRVGIRTTELVQIEKGNAVFKIKINGRVVFCKGANWIPSDSFLTRTEDSKYLSLLKASKDANMNIIRVWGGGIYENNKFYEICDKLGLLVWQDFMFACASYPEHNEFIKNIKEEVHQNVLRLQSHPSIAIWCGNNENEWGWHGKQKSSYKKMPGYKIYHSVIPNILKDIDPSRTYWPSSPFGYDENPNSSNSGNTHQWGIWSSWIDYSQVVDDQSLFVTEFGFQGPANKSTIENCLPRKNQKMHNQLFDFHNKQVEGPERVIKFLSAHLPLPQKWDDYFYLAQLNQGFALKTCLEHWLTNERTFGSIIWQLNDCWPVTSWSLIDSESTPKMSYHFVKNIFSQQLVYFSKKEGKLQVNAQNMNQQIFTGICRIFIIDGPSGKIIKRISKRVNLEQNSKYTVDSILLSKIDTETTIIIAELFNSKRVLVNTNYYKELPWKYYKLAKSTITFELLKNKDKQQIILKSDKPAYFVDLYLEGVEFSNRGFTIMPGEDIKLNMSTSNNDKIKISDIKIYSLNNYLK